MKEMVRRLDADYGFALTEEEIELIAKQVETANRLFKPLFEVDVTGIMPLMKVDRKPKPRAKPKRTRK
jgi:Asp-tRNA(Asn)/Glu-tRNA(Gln) amidotransferase C subunit